MIVYRNYLGKKRKIKKLIETGKKYSQNSKLKNKQSPNSVPDDEPPFTIDIKRLRFEEDDVNDNNSFRLRVLHLILQYKINKI